MIGEQAIVLIRDSQDGIAQGQRHLRNCQKHCPDQQIMPTDRAKGDGRQTRRRMHIAQGSQQSGIAHKCDGHAGRQQQKHGGNYSVAQQKQREEQSERAQPPAARHQPSAIEHEAEPQAQDDTDHDRPAHDACNPLGRACCAKHQPDQPGRECRAIDGTGRDYRCLRGLGGGDGADGFHRLHRHWRLVIEPNDNHREAEGEQHPDRVDPQHLGIGDSEGNECSQIAECAGQFGEIEPIAAAAGHGERRVLAVRLLDRPPHHRDIRKTLRTARPIPIPGSTTRRIWRR